MGEINTKWLPHLAEEIVSEIEDNYLDSYVVALEGWRRGLTLKWHVKDSEKFKEMKTWYVDEPGQLFSLHSKTRSHYFFRTRGDKIPNEAVEQGMDKERTKGILSEKNIPVPKGREFTKDTEEDEIIAYANKIGYPVVIKPTDGSFGRGVMANLTSDEECKHALDYVRNELNEEKIIVEKYINGKDYRLYVVDDQVVAAILRVPPNITGDGINSIEALIDIKNQERSLNPRLATTPIKIDQELVDYIGKSGYDLQTIPEKGELIYLSDKCNISIGGDPIDVFDELSDEMKELAVKALRAIPGLVHGAVDLMIEKAKDGREKGYIIELNPTAQLGGLLFPLKGTPRDVPKAIIDYYFPETKGIDWQTNHLYFNYQKVLRPLHHHISTITTVPTIEVESMKTEEWTMTGTFQNIDDQREIKKQALLYYIFGYIKEVESNKITLIVSSDASKLANFKQALHDKLQIENIEVEASKDRIQACFEMKGGKHTFITRINSQQKQLVSLQQAEYKLHKKHSQMIESTSWRITAPLRKLVELIKR